MRMGAGETEKLRYLPWGSWPVALCSRRGAEWIQILKNLFFQQKFLGASPTQNENHPREGNKSMDFLFNLSTIIA